MRFDSNHIKSGATRGRGPRSPSDQQEAAFSEETDFDQADDSGWKKPDEYQGRLGEWYQRMKSLFESDDGNYEDPQPVESSNVKAIGYDPSKARLRVQFLNGGDYQYAGVPEKTYDNLMDADSHGSSFHDLVRSRYSYKRMDDKEDKVASVLSDSTKRYLNEGKRFEKVGFLPPALQKPIANLMRANRASQPVKKLYEKEKPKDVAEQMPATAEMAKEQLKNKK